jgi:predicted RNase H-like HicB family nuclease
VRRYTVVLTPEIEDGGYSVSVPALPGCYSQGETVEEALAQIRDAIGLHIWSLEQEGEPIQEDVTPIIRAVEAEPLPGDPPSSELLAVTDPSAPAVHRGA